MKPTVAEGERHDQEMSKNGLVTLEAHQQNQEQKKSTGLTLEEVRAKLSGKTGKKYWRSLEELADKPGFGEMLSREFPQQASEWIDPVSRRGFLKLAGASLALAGLSGCTKQPDEPIYPYIKAPEDLILGKPMYFATAFPFPTGAVPVLVKSDAFRPIKVDGNPDHPSIKGGSDPFTQGTLLDLYDPDRSQHIIYRGETGTWVAFQAAWRSALADKKSAGGAGVYFLSGTVTSPTLAAQWKKAQVAFPNAKWIQYDAVNRDSAYATSKAAFGDYVDAQYKLDAADVILSLDADFLSGAVQPGFHKLAKDYANKRRLDGTTEMNRLYVVESWTTTTGLKAEHRLALRASDIVPFAAALAGTLGSGSASYNGPDDAKKYLAAVAKDLKANAGKCVVIPGEQQSPAVHAAAIAINEALGNVGKTVIYTETVNPLPSIQTADLKSLVADMNAGKVEWLVILDSNPVYSTPADLKFEEALGKVKTVVHLGSHVDETALISQWHLNSAHYLESWSDARAYDGTVTIIQPMIEPLYGGHTAHEIVQAMLDNPDLGGYGAVRENWRQQLSAKGDFEFNWRKVLHDGFIADTAFQPKSGGASKAAQGGNNQFGDLPITARTANSGADAVELVFRPDYNLYDGRFANVGWLQELPRPVTNLSWDNAAQMSYATLNKYNLAEHDVVEISVNGLKVLAPVFAVPGHPDDTVALTLGQGRSRAGRVGSGFGFNAYAVRSSDAPLFVTGANLRKTGEVYEFAVTKSHYIDHRSVSHGGDGSGTHSIEGNEAMDRGIIRYATLEEFKQNPNFAQEGEGHDTPEPDTSMFPAYRYDKNAWGMSIDMNACVGCNACIVSCYAENNIAVVGKQQVKVGRNM
jgi:MoCo/4Fe-4S cofactor protein with predicted Tat translocation signal